MCPFSINHPFSNEFKVNFDQDFQLVTDIILKVIGDQLCINHPFTTNIEFTLREFKVQ